MADYIGALVLLGVGLLIGVVLVVLPQLITIRRDTPQKHIPYESGMDPVGPIRPRFSVHYYKVAMIFTVFDVELALLYPWVGFFPEDPRWAIGVFLAFTAVIAVGYVYLLQEKVFDWAREEL
jgi:NADH-quinone oxidoreductase subunit A